MKLFCYAKEMFTFRLEHNHFDCVVNRNHDVRNRPFSGTSQSHAFTLLEK